MKLQFVPDPMYGRDAVKCGVVFPNEFDISFIRHNGSYGYPRFYEAWVNYKGKGLRGTGISIEMDEDTHDDGNGVIGWLTLEQCEQLADYVSGLSIKAAA